jgi:hypothetical protein
LSNTHKRHSPCPYFFHRKMSALATQTISACVSIHETCVAGCKSDVTLDMSPGLSALLNRTAPSNTSLPTTSSPTFRGSDILPVVVLPPTPPVVEKDGVLNWAGDDEEESTVASKERRDNSEKQE